MSLPIPDGYPTTQIEQRLSRIEELLTKILEALQ